MHQSEQHARGDGVSVAVRALGSETSRPGSAGTGAEGLSQGRGWEVGLGELASLGSDASTT